MRVSVVGLVAFLFAPLAGCTAGGDFEAYGSVDRALVGWAYAGRGIREAEGEWRVDVDAGSNEGRVRLAATVGNDSWLVTMDDFRAFASYQSGGVRCGHREHGNAGNGGPEVPEVAIHCSGWGYAKATRNDSRVTDPTTGAERLKAHFMVTEDGVRGDDGRITSHGGSRDYDPRVPADGRVFPGEAEFHLLLLAGDGSDAPWYHFEGGVVLR